MRRVEPVADTPDGLYEGGLSRSVYLASEVADVDVYDVRAGIEGVIPDGREELLPTQSLARVAHEVLKEGELALTLQFVGFLLRLSVQE